MSQYLELKKINVNRHTEKKGNLTYLSWAWAVDQLLTNDALATWAYSEPVSFGDTMMVFCTVNAFGKAMTAQLPVMDNRNKAITNPDSMAVNTAMQRCLAKAIALHGIGLYIYAGEDLPDVPIEIVKSNLTPDLTVNWNNAKQAFIRDGNLISVLKRVNMSGEHQSQLMAECETKNDIS